MKCVIKGSLSIFFHFQFASALSHLFLIRFGFIGHTTIQAANRMAKLIDYRIINIAVMLFCSTLDGDI